MKKSKIIIPALGMLILSTAASVTGTVAWFTTVSSATANITSFAVRKLGGDLDYVVAAGTGTEKVTPSDPKSSIQLTGDNPALCDASYDHVNNVLYKANSNATSFSSAGAESVSNWGVEGKDASNNDIITYYAVTWTYTFTYTFGGAGEAVNLYFDSQASEITPTTITAAAGSQTEQTYKGFRIAFICGSRKVVWAGEQASGNCKYITSGTTISYPGGVPTYSGAGTYSNVNSDSATGDLLDSTGVAIVAENSNGSAARADYLGQFTTGTGNNVLTVKCVAWYEGTDPNVVNGSEMDRVAASLGFYTRPNQA